MPPCSGATGWRRPPGTPASLDDIVAGFGDAVVPLRLDVTDRDAVFRAVAETHRRFGRLDVVVNNAGYGLFGRARGDQRGGRPGATRGQPVRQAVGHPGRPPLPEGAGRRPHPAGVEHGWAHHLPDAGDLPRLQVGPRRRSAKSLAQEVAGHGIRVTLVEPGGYATDWGGRSAVHSRPLAGIRRRCGPGRTSPGPATRYGDPDATAEAILAVVDAEEPPRRTPARRPAPADHPGRL